MKAIVWEQSGPPEVLQLREVATPTPKDNQVLIKIHASTVSSSDCVLRRSRNPLTFMLLRLIQRGPIILGQELAGEIEAVGTRVTHFKPKDQVVAWTGFRLGTYAEYSCLRETAVMALKPSSITYEEAAPIAIGGLEAAYFIRAGQIQSGERVLIIGAGGSIGTYAVQIARYFGAEVTAVDSADKLDMLREIGAKHVIDYAREDFAESGKIYDVILDVIGTSSFYRTMEMLSPNGRYLLANSRPPSFWRQRLSEESGKKVITWKLRSAREYAGDFRFLWDLMGAGNIKSVIDKSFSLEDVAEAHLYVETGLKKGQVVLRVAQSR